MFKVILRRFPLIRGGAARVICRILECGESGARDLRAGLRRAGRPLSAARFREVIANLSDAGVVRSRQSARDRGWGLRYSLAALPVLVRGPHQARRRYF